MPPCSSPPVVAARPVQPPLEIARVHLYDPGGDPRCLLPPPLQSCPTTTVGCVGGGAEPAHYRHLTAGSFCLACRPRWSPALVTAVAQPPGANHSALRWGPVAARVARHRTADSSRGEAVPEALLLLRLRDARRPRALSAPTTCRCACSWPDVAAPLAVALSRRRCRSREMGAARAAAS